MLSGTPERVRIALNQASRLAESAEDRRFILVFRIFAGWMFFYATLSDAMFNPNYVATHVIPVKSAWLFHPLFSMLADPGIATIIGFLVIYGHFLIGISLMTGFMVRLSATVGIVLMILYALVAVRPPDLPRRPGRPLHPRGRS